MKYYTFSISRYAEEDIPYTQKHKPQFMKCVYRVAQKSICRFVLLLGHPVCVVYFTFALVHTMVPFHIPRKKHIISIDITYTFVLNCLVIYFKFVAFNELKLVSPHFKCC